MFTGHSLASPAELLRRDLYTPEEVADLLEFDVNFVRHAAFTGDLRAYVVDHHILGIRRADVLAWLARRAQAGSSRGDDARS
jgi:hypothetical protein